MCKLCTLKNYKTLLKETEEDLSKWKNTSRSRTVKPNTVKMSKFPQNEVQIQCNPY